MPHPSPAEHGGLVDSVAEVPTGMFFAWGATKRNITSGLIEEGRVFFFPAFEFVEFGMQDGAGAPKRWSGASMHIEEAAQFRWPGK